MRYFELWLQETDEPGGINDFDICIRGVRRPTLQEAEDFTVVDRERDDKHILHVKRIIELTRSEAEDAYDFSYEDEWPIFGQ